MHVVAAHWAVSSFFRFTPLLIPAPHDSPHTAAGAGARSSPSNSGRTDRQHGPRPRRRGTRGEARRRNRRSHPHPAPCCPVRHSGRPTHGRCPPSTSARHRKPRRRSRCHEAARSWDGDRDRMPNSRLRTIRSVITDALVIPWVHRLRTARLVVRAVIERGATLRAQERPVWLAGAAKAVGPCRACHPR